MCEIGKPVGIIDVEPLQAPVPCKRNAESQREPVTPVLVPAPVRLDEESMFETVTVYIPEE